jgi:hypothetical protein
VHNEGGQIAASCEHVSDRDLHRATIISHPTVFFDFQRRI